MKPKSRKLDPIPPGEILKEEFMVPHGLTVNGIARALAVPPGRISEIIRGRRAITADTALRLGKFFGTTPQLWLNLQTGFDLQVAELAWPKVERSIRPLARGA
jgi:addiction module HigA family antidote